HVDYTITLDNTNEQLGKGRIDAGIIPAGGTADLAFHKTVGWKPTIQGALSLLSARSVNLIISGEGSADFLSIPFTKTFTSTIDVKQYLENYMQKLR
ncbi:MAG TPA: hypothetical protein VJK52_00710, partial [Candidatus Nanoarchaeia archaeon]|nr:hypothetical protein [Candidatus Nanoarchaeia archaeon]